MPFTLAHPAAVLPLRRLVPEAMVPLIIGSMVPDTPYFLPGHMGLWGSRTHTFRGSLEIDLPVGLALLALVLLLHRPLTALLGPVTRGICLDALGRVTRPRGRLLAAPALLFGTWTHLGWDSFTHSGSWTTLHFPVLRSTVWIGSYSTELCHVLQYLSSAIGMLILALAFQRARAAATRRGGHDGPIAAGPLLAGVFVAALLAGALQGLHAWRSDSLYLLFTLLTTRSIAWFALLYTAAGALALFSRRTQPGWQGGGSHQQARGPEARADDGRDGSEHREEASLREEV